jgi:nucleoside-diphosphate-sugar epimerase
MKALVTGATGFIGSHLVERLLKKGFEITCLTRNTDRPAWIEGLDVSLFQGDCSDRDLLSGFVHGFDYIFHLSGLTKASRKEEFYSVNTGGTENIINAVLRGNPDVKRFVYISSLSAFGPKISDQMPSEEQDSSPVSVYGASKLDAEKTLLRYNDRVPISILRPSVVYGPRDREFYMLFKFIQKGFLPRWGEGHTSLVYIDDLVDAILLTIDNEEAVGKTYFISDGETHCNGEIVNEILSVLRRKPLSLRLPKKLLPLIGFFGERMSTMMGTTSMINRDKARELMYADWLCDISKAKRELRFLPKVGLSKGIQWTADWYKIHKWI